ncbi:DUF5641 domain-containing protein [Trichonephila clavipes]|nr:DUF5641 domain-containing protein [Trichonephila clavipes]
MDKEGVISTKNLVANRIATIQEMTSSEQWRYVATEDNPADFVSRGMDSLKLKTCRSITSIVEPDLTNLNENRLDNWQKITKIIQLIWKRWSVDYLNSLQQRNKWHFEKKNAKIGDMVIIKEDNLPSCQWSLGRINNIYPGKDSKVLSTAGNKPVIMKALHPLSKWLNNSLFCLRKCLASSLDLCEEAWRVVGRLEGGQTQAEVAQAIGVSQSVISRIWNRFLETGSAGR